MKWTGITLIVGTLALMLALASGNKSLITGEAPKGGQSLQSSGTTLVAERILWSWDVRDSLEHARKHIKLDFVFIPFYAGLLVYVCLLLRRKLSPTDAPRCRKLALPAAIAAVIAGIFDVVENVNMLGLIGSFQHSQPLAASQVTIVTVSSLTKFLLLLLCLVAIAALDVCRVASRRRSSTH